VQAITVKIGTGNRLIKAYVERNLYNLRRKHCIYNPQDLNIIAPVSFLVAYYFYESVIFVTNKELSMPSENAITPASNEREQAERMENRRRHLDSLFEIALVLLGKNPGFTP